MPTVTVRGFLNFRTTVDGTVIVFTPSPSPIKTPSSAIELAQIEPTLAPVDDVRPTRVNQGPVQNYPTGLVTVLGGTVVQGGATTVYETKVIGTYISGKYAQILSSTIKVKPDEEVTSPTIRPTQSFTQLPVRPTKSFESVPRVTREDESTVNAISAAKKVHPLRAKSQKLIDSSKARHMNARLALNPLKSRWAKLKEGEETTSAESTESRTTIKARKLKIGSRRFTLPPREMPKVSFRFQCFITFFLTYFPG